MADVVKRNRGIAQATEREEHTAPEPSQSPVGIAISTAATAKEVYGHVMGYIGNKTEDALLPVMAKLSAMQGKACLPASSQMDPVTGIDVHLVLIPPSPSPVPLPHPYVATVFDAKDFLSCSVMTAAAMAAPVPTGDADADAAANLAFSIGTMALGMTGLGATIKLGGFTPRTVSGVKNNAIPHFPMGASFAPVPVVKNSGHAQYGSLFLLADGEPFTGMMHMNNDCWDLGIMQLIRKKYPVEPMHLFMPTGFVMAIPSHNVIVNPTPTPINPISALTKILNLGISKLLHGALEILHKSPSRLSDALSKAICFVTGHPVDIASGMLFTDEEDFSLPGVIPFSWERTWYSDSIYKGPLGHGWYHNYDMGFSIDENNTGIFRMNDGRVVGFQLPLPGKFTFDRTEKFFLHCDKDKSFYSISDTDGLIYCFTEAIYKNENNNIKDHLLRSISNANGYAIRFEYNNTGQLVKIIDSAGRILTVENDGLGRITSIIAPHPDDKDKTFTISKYEYDDDGNMICQTDALGQVVRYEYQKHLLTKETWRNGQQWYFVYDDKTNGAKCIHTWGDGDIYNHKLTYLEGITKVENSLGHITTYHIKGGLVSSKIDGNGAEWKYRYNRYNELEWETDPLGNQQVYTHDEWGNIVTTTDPCGGFTANEYYNFKFPYLPTEAMDKAGGKWKWEYDQQGNVIERVDPLGAKTAYTYEDGLVTEIINAAGAVTALQYDKDQNVVSIKTDDEATTVYGYDRLGNCTEVTNPNDKKQESYHDLKGRIRKVYDFDDNEIDLEYDGIDNVIRYRDKQKDVGYTYRGLWKLTSRTEAGVSIFFKYDTEEQLRKVVNEHGLPYRFELDAAGNVTEEIGFDNITRQYERNAAGWVTQVNRPAKKFTKYEYDTCGRVTKVNYSDGTSETYSYYTDGSLMTATNEAAKVEFERDVMGNIIKETVNGEWIASEYDGFGNRTKITSSLGANINHQYSKLGDVLQMEANGWSANFEYDKLGLEIGRHLPGNITSKWERDAIGRPVSHLVGHTANKAINLIKRKEYVWDVNDRLKQIKDEKGVTKFEHDGWSNLAKTIFANGEEQLRNPDAVGNLFKTVDRKDRVYAKGGQLKKVNGWEYNYDAEGNLIEKKHISGDTWRYEWNDAGMLVKVIRPDKIEVSFAYDALDRRLSKRFKNTATKFVWQGNVPLHEWKEHAVTGEKLSDVHIDGNGLTTWLFDKDSFAPSGKLIDDKKYSIITDHIGTPHQMFKEDGSLFWVCELDSYGNVKMQKGDVGSCPFRFQGQYEDYETGLYYNRFRYYETDIGLYISQDPIGLLGGAKVYSYVNDANNYIDPFGLNKSCDSGKRGIAKAEADLTAAGHTIIGREVKMKVNRKNINIRADLVTKDPAGNIHVFEVKNNTGKLTSNQKASGVYDMNAPANSSTSGGGTITPSTKTRNFVVDTGNQPDVGKKGESKSGTFNVAKYED